MTTYVVATHETPTIVCPPWCSIPAEDHVSELESWEGMVVHLSADRELCPGWTAHLTSSATPSGNVDAADPPTIHLRGEGNQMSTAAALMASTALAALVTEVQA